jgi:hypothetical protein
MAHNVSAVDGRLLAFSSLRTPTPPDWCRKKHA